MKQSAKPITKEEVKFAMEAQSKGKKSVSEISAIDHEKADQLASEEQPEFEIILEPVDKAIEILEEEGVEVHESSDSGVKTFGDVMPSSSFYPDLPKESLADILDRTYKILDAQIVEDFDGKFGLSTFALLKCSDLDTGEEFTTLCGGMVVVKKIRKAIEGKLLPLIGTISKVGRYYDIQ